jgi:hypothetical protein
MITFAQDVKMREEILFLASELEAFHDCADGDVCAGNGHFKLQCSSDSEQKRLNLRAVLRGAATVLRMLASRAPDEPRKSNRMADDWPHDIPPQTTAHDFQHFCSDVQCPYDGEPSVENCKCHKSKEKMMWEHIAALEAKIADCRSPAERGRPFYGAKCPTYPSCSGGCGLGCTKEMAEPSQDEAPAFDVALNKERRYLVELFKDGILHGDDVVGAFLRLRVASRSQTDLVEKQRSLIDWISTWVSQPIGAFSTAALDGLFSMARDRISSLDPGPMDQDQITNDYTE